jgi:hypothetical protein
VEEFPKTQSIDEFIGQAAKPNTLFHGTPVPWKDFSLKARPFTPNSNWFGPGLYLTPHHELAQAFAAALRDDIEGERDPRLYSFEAKEDLNLLDLTKRPSKEVRSMFEHSFGYPSADTGLPAQASFVSYLTMAAQTGDPQPLLKFVNAAQQKGYHGLKWREGAGINMFTGAGATKGAGFEGRVYFDTANAVKAVGQIPVSELTAIKQGLLRGNVSPGMIRPGVKSEVKRVMGVIGQKAQVDNKMIAAGILGRQAKVQVEDKLVNMGLKGKRAKRKVEQVGGVLVDMLHRTKSSGRF